MTRETSIQAYKQIEAEGTLSTRRLQVLCAIAYNEPMTSNEIWIKVRQIDSYAMQHSISPRLIELERMGCVRQLTTKECSVTGRTAIVWEFTGNKPMAYHKKLSPTAILKNALRDIMKLTGSGGGCLLCASINELARKALNGESEEETAVEA